MPPKNRAVKKTKVMIGFKRRRAGRDAGKKRKRARIVKSICTTTDYKMAK